MNENYDNPTLMVSGTRRDRFNMAIRLADRNKAVGWSEAEIATSDDDDAPRVKTLVFYWTAPSNSSADFHKFPVPLDSAGMAELAWQWLQNLPSECYEPTVYDDPDVSNDDGWLVFTKMWGHVIGWESFVGVQPYSCWIGK